MVAETHLRALAELADRVRLVGVLGRQRERTRAFAGRAAGIIGHDVPVFDDLGALCAADIDYAIVLTPPNARAEIVAALAASGKGILLEKPVERDLPHARAIVTTCETAGVPLGVVFQHRTRAASAALARLMRGRALGALAIVEARVPWWRDQSYYDVPGRGTYARDGGGVLISQAIHTLDLMLHLTGPVTQVQAMARTSSLHRMEAEDFVTAGMTFANAAVGSVMATTAGFPGEAESLTLHCANAVAHLAAGVLTVNWRDGRTEVTGETAETGGGADPMAFTHAWHREVIADFDAAQSAGTPPMVTGRAALAVHALIDALIRSSHQGRTVTVPQP